MTTAPYFAQDELGAWWYHIPATGKRMSATLRTCANPECGIEFPARLAKSQKYHSRTCANRVTASNNSGEASSLWKGGRVFLSDGYIRAKHPDRGGYILEHRLVMEQHMGRQLRRHETVHHKNGQRADNRIENLELRIGAHGQGATEAHCPTCTCFQ